jgi:hypothetical protein
MSLLFPKSHDLVRSRSAILPRQIACRLQTSGFQPRVELVFPSKIRRLVVN